MEIDDKKKDNDPEWENRILCSDGKCIGIIGPDGKCKECGMSLGKPHEVEQKTIETVSDAPACRGNHEADPDGEWEERRLCPDGNCIGIIGPDGRCGICGKEG
jgi:hypothetical protein